MPTPSIQTLINDAQQVLNLDSISAVRSVVAVSLANANTGTPLNPNLTTQQLWNEFYQVVPRSKSDIESIIANQLMKFLYSPPAPGGVGANKQVIFNDGGVLAGDPQFLWDKTTNLLTVTGAATISGDLTVDTNVLKVDTTNNRVGVNTASPATDLEVRSIAFTEGTIRLYSAIDGSNASPKGSYFSFRSGTTGGGTETARLSSLNRFSNVSGGDFSISTADTSSVMQNRLTIDSGGVFTFAVGGSTAMTLNSTGLGVGTGPIYKLHVFGASPILGIQDSTSAAGGVGGTINFLAYTSGTSGANIEAQIKGVKSSASSAGELLFFTSDSSGNSQQRFMVDGTGNVGIGVTPSAGKGCLQLSSGINFPATQVASSDANTLDDYEEGTFTPVVVGTTGAGTGTYTTQLGRYTKVGRVVTCDISLVWTAHTGTGNIDIDGLPFSVLSTTGYAASAVIGYIDNIALTAGNIPIAVLWWFNTTKIRLNQTPTGGGAAAGIPMDSAGQINLSITYIVA